MQVIVNGLMTTYERWGEGSRTIVLLHGWADKAVSFMALSRGLAAGYAMVAIDLPGSGSSQQPPGPWGLREYAQFVQDFLTKIGEPQPYALVCHSNGGAIAIIGLASKVLMAEKLVLIASAGVRTTAKQTIHRLVWQNVAKVGKVATRILPAALRTRLRTRLYQAAGSDMLIAEHMQATFKRVVNQDVRDQAAQLCLPVLCIYGATDDATPPAQGQLLAERIPGSRLVTIPDAGHFVHQEKATEVAKLIKEFLA